MHYTVDSDDESAAKSEVPARCFQLMQPNKELQYTIDCDDESAAKLEVPALCFQLMQPNKGLRVCSQPECGCVLRLSCIV